MAEITQLDPENMPAFARIDRMQIAKGEAQFNFIHNAQSRKLIMALVGSAKVSVEEADEASEFLLIAPTQGLLTGPGSCVRILERSADAVIVLHEYAVD